MGAPGGGQRRILSQRAVTRRGGVDPDGAGQDDPPDPVATGRLAHPGRAHHVDLHRSDGIGVGVVDVGDRRQMEHGIAAGRGLDQTGQVGHVGVVVPDVGSMGRSGIDDDHLVTVRHQVIDHMRPDEARPAGH